MDENLKALYRSHDVGNLVRLLEQQAEEHKQRKISSIQDSRRVHRSCIEINKNLVDSRKPFNNKTKQGEFFTPQPPLAPYLFVPKHKNETVILPDRAFQKGEAAKRLHVKMKDSSITSFPNSESQKFNTFLRRKQKDEVISGRKMQELDRILDQQDGIAKATNLKWHLKTRRIFNPTRTSSDMFSKADPLLEPRQEQPILVRKTSLAKTLGPNMWRPASRGLSYRRSQDSCFSQTTSVFCTASHR